MISILIQYTSFAILASAFAYLALLVFRSYTANAAATANAEIEQKILAARVGEIMDRRRIFTQKSELSWEGFRKFEVMEKKLFLQLLFLKNAGKTAPEKCAGSRLIF